MSMEAAFKTVCQQNACVGCMLCQDICPKGAIRVEKGIKAYNAVIDPTLCIDCDLCHKMCQVEQGAALERHAPVLWKQGWSQDPSIRQSSSSGGFAQAISRAFVDKGGIVCSCVFEEGEFRFAFARTQEEVARFRGSKYVKSDPSGIYKQIKTLLNEGQSVLFIALPCQVGALKIFIPKALQEKLYTIDLICHGAPSPKLLERYLAEYHQPLTNIRDIKFRDPRKTAYYLQCDNRRLVKSESDTYSDTFISGVTYTENCYACVYSARERVSDLTLGDSWGTSLPFEEAWQGISLALANTPSGVELLKLPALHLFDVDIECAVANNGNLAHPSHKHPMRESILSQIEAGAPVRKQFLRAVPLKARLKKRVKFLIPKGVRRLVKRLLSK